jgi:hypothetical protein
MAVLWLATLLEKQLNNIIMKKVVVCTHLDEFIIIHRDYASKISDIIKKTYRKRGIVGRQLKAYC